MEIGIEIEDKKGQLEFEIFEDLYVDEREIEIEGGAIGRYISTINGVIEFIIELQDDFDESVLRDVSSWLYDKLEGKDIGSLRIENKEVSVNREDIENKIKSAIKV
jgi:hypothetical protein